MALWDAVEWSVKQAGSEFWCKPVARTGEFFYPTADLFMPISRLGWPNAMGAVQAAACREVGLDPAVIPGPTGDWIRNGMRQTFRNFVAWNDLRRDVLECLSLDPLTLALHRRIFVDRHVGLETFNWVHCHVRELSIVGIERPRLLPFLSLVWREDFRPLRSLESMLLEAGITARARRHMEKVGFGPFEHATEFGMHKDWPQVVARYAGLLERLHIDEPAAIFTAMATTRGDELPDWFYLALHREVERLIEEEDLEDPDALPQDFEEVARWVHRVRPQPDANQRRAGWSWLQAQAMRDRIREAMEHPEPWSCPYDVFTHDGFEARPIRSLLELREEALAMRNCLETYASDCLRGLMQPFSLRDAASGDRVACFMLERQGAMGRWEVLQAAGRMNQPAREEWDSIARLACERCNQQDRARRMRRP